MYYRLKDGRLVKSHHQNGKTLYLWSNPAEFTLQPPSEELVARKSESIQGVMDYSWTNRTLVGHYRAPDTINPNEKVEILIAQKNGLIVVAEYDHKREDWIVK